MQPAGGAARAGEEGGGRPRREAAGGRREAQGRGGREDPKTHRNQWTQTDREGGPHEKKTTIQPVFVCFGPYDLWLCNLWMVV